MRAQTIYIGADHAGFALKEHLKTHLSEMPNIVIEDLGAHTLNPKDDYPEFAANVAQAVRKHPGSLGILLCGNAEGICIAANKFKDIRAGIGYSVEAAKTMRNDDNANIICVPGRLPVLNEPMHIVETFLRTPFSGEERHVRRIAEIE